MKRDSISILLVFLFVLSSVTASWMCYSYLKTSRDLRNLQGLAAYQERTRSAAQQFAIDLNEYAKTHPTIYPVLEQSGLRLRINTNSPARP